MPIDSTSVPFRERAELLDFLLEVAAVTSETLNLDRLLAGLAQIIRKVVPSDLFAILLYSERRGGLIIRYAIGHREEIVKNLVIPLGTGITGSSAALGEPLLVGDVRTEPRYLYGVDAVRSELAVPMITRGRLIGVIDLQSTHLNTYTDHDRSILKLIAGRVAAAIDNARLYRQVERQNRTLRTLAHLSRDFSVLDLDELLTHIAQGLKTLIPYDAFSILLVDAARKCLRHRFSMRYDKRIELDNIPLGKGITGAAAESGKVIRSDNTLADSRYIPFHDDVRSEVAVPLIARDKVVGVMDLESSRFAHFTEEHVRMLRLLAPQVASSVENARLYEELAEREKHIERDLAAARELQAAMLSPSAPYTEGLEIAIGYRPARQISGDLYHFFEHYPQGAMIAFGDVSGKGVAAALYGALVSGLLRTMAPSRPSPAHLMQALNAALLERRVEARYISLLVLLWNPGNREFVLANAGALPPVILRAGEIIRPQVEGVPLGLLSGREYEEVRIQSWPGDLIVLYSDGVTDQTNAAGEEYGRGRLTRLIQKAGSGNAQSVVDSIFAGVDAFSGNGDAFDDQTLLVLKVK